MVHVGGEGVLRKAGGREHAVMWMDGSKVFQNTPPGGKGWVRGGEGGTQEIVSGPSSRTGEGAI